VSEATEITSGKAAGTIPPVLFEFPAAAMIGTPAFTTAQTAPWKGSEGSLHAVAPDPLVVRLMFAALNNPALAATQLRPQSTVLSVPVGFEPADPSSTFTAQRLAPGAEPI
jgi:hypothetical protein